MAASVGWAERPGRGAGLEPQQHHLLGRAPIAQAGAQPELSGADEHDLRPRDAASATAVRVAAASLAPGLERGVEQGRRREQQDDRRDE